MLVVKFLLLTGVLVAAHPHPHHAGECMEMRGPEREGRSRMRQNTFMCLEGLTMPHEEHMARKLCKTKANYFMSQFFKGDKIEGLKNNNLQEINKMKEEVFAKCMVEKLELELEDGTLDVTKILQNSLKVDSSDISGLMKLQTMINICVTNTTGTNATQQFLSMKSCMHKMLDDYCKVHQQLLQKYLQRGSDDSVCAKISTFEGDSIIEEHFKSCMMEQTLQAASETQKVLEGSYASVGSSKGRFAQTMLQSTLCVAKKMNWFTGELGFDTLEYLEFVANFTGWDQHPEVLDEIRAAMEMCDPVLIEGPHAQSHHWNKCLAPKIVDICGFNNNITKFFLPFLNADIQKSALEYIEEMSDGDSMEDIMDADSAYSDEGIDDSQLNTAEDIYEEGDYSEDDYGEVDMHDDDVSTGEVMVDDGFFVKDVQATVVEGGDSVLELMADEASDVDEVAMLKKKPLETDAEDILSQIRQGKHNNGLHSKEQDESKESETSTESAKNSQESNQKSNSKEQTDASLSNEVETSTEAANDSQETIAESAENVTDGIESSETATASV